MTALDAILEWRVTTVVGWALLQFVWQGAAIALVVAAVLPLLQERDPRERYALCVAAMSVMVLSFVATLVLALRAPSASAAALVPLAFWSRVVPQAGDSPWVSLLMPWTAVVWALGALLVQLRLASQWRYTRRLRRDVEPAGDVLQRVMHELQQRLGIARAVQVVRTTLLQVPAVLGWARPIVLVPIGVAETLTLAQLRAVLAHELAHVRRNDQIVNWIQSFVESVFFFHPAVWWLSQRIRVEREYCCDDVAVAACGDALGYARALSRLEDARALRPQAAMASTGGNLMARITRLFADSTPRNVSRWSWIALPGFVLGLALFAASCRQTPVDSQETDFQTMPAASDHASGAASTPVIEFVGFEHAPDASPTEILQAGHEHIRQRLAAGTITREQARKEMQVLKEHVHAVMDLEPETAGVLHEVHRKLSAEEIHGILNGPRDGDGHIMIDEAARAKLSPEEIVQLKVALAELQGENIWIDIKVSDP